MLGTPTHKVQVLANTGHIETNIQPWLQPYPQHPQLNLYNGARICALPSLLPKLRWLMQTYQWLRCTCCH